jgi:hypothetical protein
MNVTLMRRTADPWRLGLNLNWAGAEPGGVSQMPRDVECECFVLAQIKLGTTPERKSSDVVRAWSISLYAIALGFFFLPKRVRLAD